MKKIYYSFLLSLFLPAAMFAQPANDNCSGAIPIEINGDAVVADNTEATIYGPHGSCFWDSGNQVDGDVWFSITLIEPTALLISTEEGTSDDSQLVLFIIDDCGGENETFTEVACNDDEDFSSGMSVILTETLDPGIYYLRASTWGDESSGTYSITVTSANYPDNDTCEGAIELVLDGAAEIADNTISTINGPSGSCYGTPQLVGETWFKFTTTEVSSVRISTEDIDSGDSQVSVFTIEGCGTDNEVYTEVACNEDASGNNYMSQVDMYDLEPGTYYVKAGTYHEFFTGSYYIRLETLTGTIPPNSDCANANIQNLEIGGDMVSVTGTGTNAPNLAGVPYNHVWEAFTIDDCASVQISYCGTPEVPGGFFGQIINGCPFGAGVGVIDANEITEDECEDLDGLFTLYFDFLPAGTYYYPVLSDESKSILDEYTINFLATACPAEPDSCTYFADGPYVNFNNMFGGAPSPDENGECETYEITGFEVIPSEAYIADNFEEGVQYTFSICEGTNPGVWEPALFVLDPFDDVVAYVEGCSITWTPEITGTYIIGIAEVGACYTSSIEEDQAHGFPTLTCNGTVGVENVAKASFNVYPNPSNGNFTLGNISESGTYLIEVVDITGRVVHAQENAMSAMSETKLNVTHVVPGVYVIKMTNKNTKAQTTQRVVVE